MPASLEVLPARQLHAKSRGREISDEEMLALYSRKPGTGEGKRNMLRTSEQPSSFSVAVHEFAFKALINRFVSAVEY